MKEKIMPDDRFMNNPVCNLFGLKYPIILGGMLYAGKASLAAAVSNAGGLGILGAGRMRADELVEEIAKTAALTDRPFGVNIPLRAAKPDVLIEAALSASIHIFATSGGSPAKHIDRIKSAGAKTMQVVASVRQAISAQAAGVDAVVAEGGESGGIISKDLVSTLSLVPQVVDAVDVPVIAAGGIADGRGMAAAFALGARGIQMGTRFLACTECEISADYQCALVLACDTDTCVFRTASGMGRRTLKKALLQQAPKSRAIDGLTHREENKHPFGTADCTDAVKRVYAAGQSAGLIHEILPSAEIVHRILFDAAAAAESVRQLG